MEHLGIHQTTPTHKSSADARRLSGTVEGQNRSEVDGDEGAAGDKPAEEQDISKICNVKWDFVRYMCSNDTCGDDTHVVVTCVVMTHV